MDRPLLVIPDPRKVRRAFGRAAARYDAAAALQREIAARLDEHLAYTRLQPRRILDLGCGTGFLAERLRARYPHATIVLADLAEPMVCAARRRFPRRWWRRARECFCCADGHALPFPSGTFDLVASNLVLQWAADPNQMLREMRRVTRRGGLLLFSTFGRRTLGELKRILAELGRGARALGFPDPMALGDALHGLAVESTVVDADLFTVTYPSVRALLGELKAIGASASALPSGPKGLGGRAFLTELERRYRERFATDDGRIRATFEALYAQAWAGERPGDSPRAVPPGV